MWKDNFSQYSNPEIQIFIRIQFRAFCFSQYSNLERSFFATHHPCVRTPRTTHTPTTHAVVCPLPYRVRKPAFPGTAAERARSRQQGRGQCTWHGIGRLSSWHHGDRMSGRGSPWRTIFSYSGLNFVSVRTIKGSSCLGVDRRGERFFRT